MPRARHVGGRRHPARRELGLTSFPFRAKNGNRATKNIMVPMVEAVLARLKKAAPEFHHLFVIRIACNMRDCSGGGKKEGGRRREIFCEIR